MYKHYDTDEHISLHDCRATKVKYEDETDITIYVFVKKRKHTRRKECELKMSTDKATYYWNELCKDKVW